MKTRLLRLLFQIGFLAGLLALWQWMASTGRVNKIFTGEPSAIYDQLRHWENTGALWSAITATLQVLALGALVGFGVGIVLGVLLGTSRWCKAVLEPYVMFANATPRLILLPFLVVWLGFELSADIVLVTLVIFVMVALNVMTGMAQVPRDLVNNVHGLGGSRWDVIRQVYLPAMALWMIGTSCGTIGIAFQTAIIAQFTGNNTGLGYFIVLGQNTLQINTVWAALFIAVLLAMLIDGLFAWAQTRSMRWMPSVSL